MMVLRRLLARVAAVGVVAEDSDQVRLQKVTLTFATCTVTSLAVIWVDTSRSTCLRQMHRTRALAE